jgi:hypothetical protein
MTKTSLFLTRDYGKRGDQLILISETQLDKMIKVKRGEIIIFRKFKVLTVGSKS